MSPYSKIKQWTLLIVVLGLGLLLVFLGFGAPWKGGGCGGKTHWVDGNPSDGLEEDGSDPDKPGDGSGADSGSSSGSEDGPAGNGASEVSGDIDPGDYLSLQVSLPATEVNIEGLFEKENQTYPYDKYLSLFGQSTKIKANTLVANNVHVTDAATLRSGDFTITHRIWQSPCHSKVSIYSPGGAHKKTIILIRSFPNRAR